MIVKAWEWCLSQRLEFNTNIIIIIGSPNPDVENY